MKVALTRCSDYESASVEAALDRAMALLGGWEAFVKPGQSVLLKPNLLTDREPDAAVTTHPAVARAAIRTLKRLGAKPWVADSPNSVTKLDKVWDKTGFQALCEAEHVPLVNLEKAGAVHIESGGFSFTVAKPVLEADVIVNLPKVKTHVLTILTAGVKNMYGTVPGFYKTNLHKSYPRPREFGKLVLEICRKTRPTLTVADAVVGMEGDGPSGGQPVRLGFLAASADPVSLDLALCRILGIRPEIVPYLRPVQKGVACADCHPELARDLGGTPRNKAFSRSEIPRKLGMTESSKPFQDAVYLKPCAEPEIVGDDPDTLLERPIKVPSTFRGRMIPGPLVKLIGRALWIRPSFSDACVRCGLCVKACPVDALALPDGASRPVWASEADASRNTEIEQKATKGTKKLEPSVPLSEAGVQIRKKPLWKGTRKGARRCIGCCCCHEICPQRAVTMRPSPLLNLFRRGRPM